MTLQVKLTNSEPKILYFTNIRGYVNWDAALFCMQPVYSKQTVGRPTKNEGSQGLEDFMIRV